MFIYRNNKCLHYKCDRAPNTSNCIWLRGSSNPIWRPQAILCANIVRKLCLTMNVWLQTLNNHFGLTCSESGSSRCCVIWREACLEWTAVISFHVFPQWHIFGMHRFMRERHIAVLFSNGRIRCHSYRELEATLLMRITEQFIYFTLSILALRAFSPIILYVF